MLAGQHLGERELKSCSANSVIQGGYAYLRRRSTGQQIPRHSGYRSSIPAHPKGDPKHLKTGRLS